MTMELDEDTLLQIAGEVLQFPPGRQWSVETTRRKFRAHFGCSPAVVVSVWKMLRPVIDKPAAAPKHLLWALVFLKMYSTEEVHCRIVGWPDPKTFRTWSMYFIEKIASLHTQVILLDNRFDGIDFSQPPATNCYVSLDCTDCPVNEPWPFDKSWYSQKLNGPGVKYEVGICILTGYIVWINGPFKASVSDVTVFRDKLKDLLCDDEGAEVDGVYGGDPKLKAPKVAKASVERKQKSLVRARHEIVNGRLKIYNVLNLHFRHKGRFGTKEDVMLEKHGHCFTAVAVLTQLGFVLGEIQINQVEYNVEYW